MRYQILTDENAFALASQVIEAMAEGWTPCGGVAVSTWVTHGDACCQPTVQSEYAQAMVRA